jgi:hypothetical protein
MVENMTVFGDEVAFFNGSKNSECLDECGTSLQGVVGLTRLRRRRERYGGSIQVVGTVNASNRPLLRYASVSNWERQSGTKRYGAVELGAKDDPAGLCV